MFGTGESVKTIPENFDEAEKYLAFRIHHQDFVNSFKEGDIIFRKDLEGTVTVLVLDLPDSVEVLMHTGITKWNKSPEELFVIAIKNLKEKYTSRDVERLENKLLNITGEDIFITSETLYFERNKECIGNFGAIFCLPNKETLRAFALNSDLDIEVGLQMMIPFAEETFDRSEDKITRNIFWHFEGKNELIYTYYGLNRLKYILPADLADMAF
jgi:hypothetical protein